MPRKRKAWFVRGWRLFGGWRVGVGYVPGVPRIYPSFAGPCGGIHSSAHEAASAWQAPRLDGEDVSAHQILGFVRTDPAYRRALRSWCRYYADTEEYDRKTCSGRTDRGDAIPVNPEERRRSSAYARRQHERVVREIGAIDATTRERARNAALAMTFDEQKRVAREDE